MARLYRELSKLIGLGLFSVMLNSGFCYAEASPDALTMTVQQVEQQLGGRVGVAVLDRANNRLWHYKGGAVFPLTSTFKALACAAVLARVDVGKESLARSIMIREKDLLSYAPVTTPRLNTTMTVTELCAAAMSLSDNTAGNLILESIGGPKGFTDFMRTLDDKKTQLSRWEPDLNEAVPGQLRDTTTPDAIVSSLNKVLFSNSLSSNSQQQLKQWLSANKVGGALIRSVLPAGWRIGDRTGAGGFGSRAIIALISPPERLPIIVAIYLTQTTASMDERNKAIVKIARAIIKSID